MRKIKELSLIISLLTTSGMASAGNVSVNGVANVELDNGNIEITYGSNNGEAQAPHRHSRPGASAPADIPPGHMPSKGECRVWFHDRESGQQPPPEKCEKLRRNVPPGASLIRG